MFGVPLLMTGMFYFMFGSIANDDSGFNLPRTKVVIANLDQGSEQIQAGLAQSSQELPASTLGDTVVQILQNEEFAKLLDISQHPMPPLPARRSIRSRPVWRSSSRRISALPLQMQARSPKSSCTRIPPSPSDRASSGRCSAVHGQLRWRQDRRQPGAEQPGGMREVDQIMQDLVCRTHPRETVLQEPDARRRSARRALPGEPTTGQPASARSSARSWAG